MPLWWLSRRPGIEAELVLGLFEGLHQDGADPPGTAPFRLFRQAVSSPSHSATGHSLVLNTGIVTLGQMKGFS